MVAKSKSQNLMHEIDTRFTKVMIGLLLIIIGCQFAKTLNAQAIAPSSENGYSQQR